MNPSPRVELSKKSLVGQTAPHRYLVVALALYGASVPLSVLPLLGSYSPALVAEAVVVLALINRRLSGGRQHFGIIPILCLAYLAAATASYFWSVDPIATRTSLFSLGLNVVIVLGLANLSPSEVVRILPPLAYSTAILATVALLAPTQVGREGRANVSGVDENVTAYALAIGLAVAVGLIPCGASKVRRATYWMISAVCMLALLHLGSRTGAGATALVAVVAYSATVRADVGKLPVRIVGLFIASAMGLVILHAAIASGLVPLRIQELMNGAGFDDDSGRSHILSLYKSVEHEWWLRGVGYGADSTFIGNETGYALNIHSQFWSSWIELGVVGVGVLVGLCLTAARASLRKGVPVAVVAVFPVVVLFGYTLGGDKTHMMWFALGLLAATSPRSSARNAES